MRRIVSFLTIVGVLLFPTGSASAAAPPVGNFDQVLIEADGTIIAQGWAVDLDEPSATLDIHVYADDELIAAGPADGSRPDVAEAIGVDPDHGFAIELALDDGTYDVCAFAIDVASENQGNPNLGCADLTIGEPAPAPPAPTPDGPLQGWLDAVAPLPDDRGFQVRGWTFDPGAIARSVVVHVYVDDELVSVRTADGSRPDVGAALGGIGDDHGFAVNVPFALSGEHDVCVWALADPAGVNVQIGCAPVAGGLVPEPEPPSSNVTISPDQPFQFEILN